jgi:alanyl-tRNA synthetase
MKSSKEIRNDFVKFFTDRGHVFVPSAPVVPQDDPTLLFTNAGMNQFKAIFLGDNPKNLKRAANSQKCMRVSGKHNDLEEVGRDHYHHTFFEMLGNWSFGDYYKKEAIKWAWELLTEVWKLPKERLFVTIHTNDDEAERFWKSETDIAHDRIMRFGDKSNFWEMGETGPCGPCSEIHYDMGDLSSQKATFSDPVEGVNGQNARYRELWNLVFMQYNREKGGALKPLPSTHVDTGMGFERIVSVIQGVGSNYDTDIFQPVIRELEVLSGKKYDAGEAGTPFRVIADHIRSLVFSITDGAFPSNEGRGYVLRRLLRRAFRFGRELGFRAPFMHKLVAIVIAEMGDAFPEITQRRSFVEEVILSEEERFGTTLEQGIEKFNTMIEHTRRKGGNILAGTDVFTLYDTYGFPMDLTRLMASEKGFVVDEEGYEQFMEQQKGRARDARKHDDGLTPDGWTEIKPVSGTEFVGYDKEEASVQVCRLKKIEDENGKNSFLLILDRTPFYAESGGQTGDTGMLVTSTGKEFFVNNTIKWNDLIIHKAYANENVSEKDFTGTLCASIDTDQRLSTRRNHSATHLLQAALRKVLGDHVQQSGSKVEPSGLRFDFTHFKSMSADEIEKVERQVNAWVMENAVVTTDIKGLDAAKSEGATALFGEKYGDKVRVVSMGQISKELCGGTHVSATGQIGMFHITLETSISAGVRRIEAVTGNGSLDFLYNKEKTIASIASHLKTGEDKLFERVVALTDTVKALEEQVKTLSTAKAAGIIGEYFVEARKNSTALPWVVKNLGEVDKDTFAQVSDAITDEIKNKNITDIVIFLGAKVADKVLFSASAGAASVKTYGIHCGELVKTAAQKAGGGGGGSPIRAQAGGKDPMKLVEALEAITAIISSKAGIAK